MKAWLGQGASWAHLTHLTTCLWMVAALIQTGEVNLTKWAKYIPCRGQYAQSRQRRIRRWLGNSRINVHRLYKPIIQAVLAKWEDSCVYVSLETTQFWKEYCLIRLAVVHRGRALPLAWRVLEHGSATVAFSEYQAMLIHSARYLPKGVKVILLADRGFVHTDAMSAVRRLGWHYRIRLKGNTWLWRSKGGWIQPQALHLARGEVRCFHHISSRGMARFMSSVDVTISMANSGLWSAMNPPRYKLSKNTACASILKNFSKTSSPVTGIYRNRRFARSVTSLDSASFWPWRPFTSPPRAWPWLSKVSADGSIPTGFAATAISALAWTGCKLPCLMDGS
ncbi:MAG: hypothetical protein AAGE59_38580 [Cyanobacteria bacterium P01_F01_bin.86]